MSHRLAMAALVAASLACMGCCGGLTCGNSCSTGSPHAFEKYDCSCETCGPGWCGGGAGCGDGCTCGDTCTCGDGCAEGACLGGCADCGWVRDERGCARCSHCGKRSPCCVFNLFCRCTGCGEVYWNEWVNDPPACAEPCDCYGNWIGPGAVGFYRAPYRMHDVYVGSAAPQAEVESGSLATGADAATPIDEAPATKPASAAAPVAEGAGLTTAGYDDSALDAELQ